MAGVNKFSPQLRRNQRSSHLGNSANPPPHAVSGLDYIGAHTRLTQTIGRRQTRNPRTHNQNRRSSALLSKSSPSLPGKSRSSDSPRSSQAPVPQAAAP